MAAASVGLSMALISIAKLLLLFCGIAVLVQALRGKLLLQGLKNKATPAAVLLVLLAFSLSLFWTIAPSADAWGSLAKYGKLLVILVLMLLIQNRREAMYALAFFVIAQLFLVLSSWMLFVHLPVPWATSNMALKEYAVFSSYLDQGIMGAVLAAICWHTRKLFPGRYGQHLAIAIAVVSMSNVLFVLSGRSGHVVAIALLSIAIMWELPGKFRAAVVVLPFLIVMALYASSEKVRGRLDLVSSEVQTFSSTQQSVTSSGIRLGLWLKAVQMIREHPLAGLGVGSWSTEYNRLRRQQNPASVDIQGNGNPHQEYLQWGVQLGIPGMLLFLALLLAVFRDALRMPKEASRAAQSTLVALSVACLFNSSLYDALIGDFFCVSIGLLLALGANTSSRADESTESVMQVPASAAAA